MTVLFAEKKKQSDGFVMKLDSDTAAILDANLS
jgi:hypothetical protein